MVWGTIASMAISEAASDDAADATAGGYATSAKQMRKQGKLGRKAMKRAFKSQQRMSKPWRDAGRTALSQMQAGIADGSFSPGEFSFDFEAFKNDPSYQFTLQENMRMAEQSAAARGKLGSGQTLKALQDRGQALAAGEYQNAFNRAVTTHELNRALGMDEFSRLGAIEGAGRGMTSQLMGARERLGQNIAQNRMNVASGTGAAAIGEGAARGTGFLNQANVMNQGIGNLMYQRRAGSGNQFRTATPQGGSDQYVLPYEGEMGVA